MSRLDKLKQAIALGRLDVEASYPAIQPAAPRQSAQEQANQLTARVLGIVRPHHEQTVGLCNCVFVGFSVSDGDIEVVEILRQLTIVVRAVSWKPDESLVLRLDVELGVDQVQDDLGHDAGGIELSRDRIVEAVRVVCVVDAGRECGNEGRCAQ